MLIPLRLSAQTDEQLMLRAARGSDRAFEELYNRHARRLGEDSDLAADFMHDTFLRLYAARESYREGKSFRAWLYTIAYNLCKNHLRNRLTMVHGKGEEAMDTTDIEVEMDTSILHDALSQILRDLPEDYAMLFSLHYEEELSVPQVAQITSLPEGTIKSRLHKTMTLIKQKLQQYEDRR